MSFHRFRLKPNKTRQLLQEAIASKEEMRKLFIPKKTESTEVTKEIFVQKLQPFLPDVPAVDIEALLEEKELNVFISEQLIAANRLRVERLCGQSFIQDKMIKLAELSDDSKKQKELKQIIIQEVKDVIHSFSLDITNDDELQKIIDSWYTDYFNKVREWRTKSIEFVGVPKVSGKATGGETSQTFKEFEVSLKKFIANLKSQPELKDVPEVQIRDWILNSTGNAGPIIINTLGELDNELRRKGLQQFPDKELTTNRIEYHPGKGLCFISQSPGVLQSDPSKFTAEEKDIPLDLKNINSQMTVKAYARFPTSSEEKSAPNPNSPTSEIDAEFLLVNPTSSVYTKLTGKEQARTTLSNHGDITTALNESKSSIKTRGENFSPLLVEEKPLVLLDIDGTCIDTHLYGHTLTPELLTILLWCEASKIPYAFPTNHTWFESKANITAAMTTANNPQQEAKRRTLSHFSEELEKREIKLNIHSRIDINSEANQPPHFKTIVEKEKKFVKSLPTTALSPLQQEQEIKRLIETMNDHKENKNLTNPNKVDLIEYTVKKTYSDLEESEFVSALHTDNKKEICEALARNTFSKNVTLNALHFSETDKKTYQRNQALVTPCLKKLAEFTGLNIYARRLLLTKQFNPRTPMQDLSAIRYLLQTEHSSPELRELIKTYYEDHYSLRSNIDKTDLDYLVLNRDPKYFYKELYPSLEPSRKQFINEKVSQHMPEPHRSDCLFTAAKQAGWWTNFRNQYRSAPLWPKITAGIFITIGVGLLGTGLFSMFGLISLGIASSVITTAAIGTGSALISGSLLAHVLDIKHPDRFRGKLSDLNYLAQKNLKKVSSKKDNGRSTTPIQKLHSSRETYEDEGTVYRPDESPQEEPKQPSGPLKQPSGSLKQTSGSLWASPRPSFKPNSGSRQQVGPSPASPQG